MIRYQVSRLRLNLLYGGFAGFDVAWELFFLAVAQKVGVLTLYTCADVNTLYQRLQVFQLLYRRFISCHSWFASILNMFMVGFIPFR